MQHDHEYQRLLSQSSCNVSHTQPSTLSSLQFKYYISPGSFTVVETDYGIPIG